MSKKEKNLREKLSEIRRSVNPDSDIESDEEDEYEDEDELFKRQKHTHDNYAEDQESKKKVPMSKTFGPQKEPAHKPNKLPSTAGEHLKRRFSETKSAPIPKKLASNAGEHLKRHFSEKTTRSDSQEVPQTPQKRSNQPSTASTPPSHSRSTAPPVAAGFKNAHNKRLEGTRKAPEGIGKDVFENLRSNLMEQLSGIQNKAAEAAKLAAEAARKAEAGLAQQAAEIARKAEAAAAAVQLNAASTKQLISKWDGKGLPFTKRRG